MAVCNMALGDSQGRVALDTGGIELVLKAMYEHPRDVDVQQASMWHAKDGFQFLRKNKRSEPPHFFQGVQESPGWIFSWRIWRTMLRTAGRSCPCAAWSWCMLR